MEEPNGKRKIILSKTNSSDPKVVAERLVRRVLGDENYTDLAALGKFTIILPSENEYTLYRKRKTEAKLAKKYLLPYGRADKRLHWDAGTYSCCIHPEDTSCPDADRIVAEYVLLCNDEQKYLFTANLTAIFVPNGAIPMTGGQFEALRNGIWRDYNVILNSQIDALRYGFPPRLMTNPPDPNPEPAIQPLPQPPQDPLIQHLAHEICRRLYQHERLRGFRFMNVIPEQVRWPRTFGVDFTIDDIAGNSERQLDYILHGVIPTVVEQLLEAFIYSRPVGTFRLPLPGGADQGVSVVMPEGGSLRLLRQYDFARHDRPPGYVYRADIGLALSEDPATTGRDWDVLPPRRGRTINWIR